MKMTYRVTIERVFVPGEKSSLDQVLAVGENVDVVEAWNEAFLLDTENMYDARESSALYDRAQTSNYDVTLERMKEAVRQVLGEFLPKE